MSQLTDIKVDDLTFFSKKYRFKVTYVFLSLYYNTRFFFSFFLKEHENIMDVTELYPSAGFLQREAWDEFGIKFIDYEKKRNIIQRRLLMDYGFKGHPLKKNFPLTGFVEIVYNQEKRRIVMIPLCLLQEYRKFSFKDF